MPNYPLPKDYIGAVSHAAANGLPEPILPPKGPSLLSRIDQIFNPFNHVIYKSNISPHSASLHTTLWQKFKQTRRAFKGEQDIFGISDTVMPTGFDPFNFYARLGLLDFIPPFLILGRLLHYLFDRSVALFSDNLGSKNRFRLGVGIAGIILFGAMHFALNGIARSLATLGLTIFFAPAVILAHIVTQSTQQILTGQYIEQTQLQANHRTPAQGPWLLRKLGFIQQPGSRLLGAGNINLATEKLRFDNGSFKMTRKGSKLRADVDITVPGHTKLFDRVSLVNKHARLAQLGRDAVQYRAAR
jgi:hypothetical protein